MTDDSKDNVVTLGSILGSHLCTVSYYRQPTGEVKAVLDHMPEHVIDHGGGIAPLFFAAATWTVEGSLDLMRQGCRFDEETRKSKED